jgi:hypothetical protein
MTSPERERAAWAAVDDALRAYPLAEPPTHLKASVMRRLSALARQPARAPRPRFQLQWIDLALSTFSAGMLIVCLVGWRLLPADQALMLAGQFQLEAALTAQYLQLPMAGPLIALGLVLAAVLLALAGLVLAAPRASTAVQ